MLLRIWVGVGVPGVVVWRNLPLHDLERENQPMISQHSGLLVRVMGALSAQKLPGAPGRLSAFGGAVEKRRQNCTGTFTAVMCLVAVVIAAAAGPSFSCLDQWMGYRVEARMIIEMRGAVDAQ